MALESRLLNNVATFFKPVFNSKILGGVLLLSYTVTLGVGVYNIKRARAVNRIFIEAKGDTNAVLTVYEKADFIRTRPGYQPTNNAVEYFVSKH